MVDAASARIERREGRRERDGAARMADAANAPIERREGGRERDGAARMADAASAPIEPPARLVQGPPASAGGAAWTACVPASTDAWRAHTCGGARGGERGGGGSHSVVTE